jgi:signal transduction histidine kinase
LRLKLSNGSYRWYAFVGIPQFAPDDRFDGHLGMCVDVSAKRRAESALKTVAGKLVAAQEEERNRVARELHDDIGQQVALLLSGLDTLLDARRATGERMRSGLEGVRRHLHELASSVHSLSYRLHPAKLRLLGLIPTLAALCRDVSAQSGIDVRFDPAEIVEAIPGPVALCLFRVTQEALQNAVKHSGARRVQVTLAKGPRRLTLRITDKGKGFDPLSSQSMGLGLLTMRERVELSGGRLRLETGSGRGTTIEAMLPVTDDDAR